MLLTFSIRIEKYYITGKRGWHISNTTEKFRIVRNRIERLYVLGTYVDEIKIATVTLKVVMVVKASHFFKSA